MHCYWEITGASEHHGAIQQGGGGVHIRPNISVLWLRHDMGPGQLLPAAHHSGECPGHGLRRRPSRTTLQVCIREPYDEWRLVGLVLVWEPAHGRLPALMP